MTAFELPRSNNTTTGRDIDSVSSSLRRALDRFLDDLASTGGAPSTCQAYRRDLERYLSIAGKHGAHEPADLAHAHVTALLESLAVAGLSSATVARNISSLRQLHEYLRKTGLCPHDPTTGVAPPKMGPREPEPLTLAQAERLLNAVPGNDPLSMRDRAILETLYATGLRVSELTALACSDLMAAARLLRIHGRGPRERVVPLTEAALLSLQRYLDIGRQHLAHQDLAPQDDEDILFLNAQGRSLSRMGVWKIIRAAADTAGLQRNVSPATLRHTFAAHRIDSGALVQDVQHQLGHADISSTQVYAHPDKGSPRNSPDGLSPHSPDGLSPHSRAIRS